MLSRCLPLRATPNFQSYPSVLRSWTLYVQSMVQSHKVNNGSSLTFASSPDEIQREKELREKVMKAAGFSGSEAMFRNFGNQQGGGSGNGGPGGIPRPAMPKVDASQTFMNVTALIALIYVVIQMMKNRNDPSSFHVPLWVTPRDVSARWLLIRLCLDMGTVDRIKSEFETAHRQNPFLTLQRYLDTAYPNILAGRNYTQNEAIWYLSQSIATASQYQLVRMLSSTVGFTPADRVDNLVNAMKQQFPNLRPPPPGWGHPIPAVPMYGQPNAVYGGNVTSGTVVYPPSLPTPVGAVPPQPYYPTNLPGASSQNLSSLGGSTTGSEDVHGTKITF
eukprot:PhF_6_TR33578/c0_g1_i1/m.48999